MKRAIWGTMPVLLGVFAPALRGQAGGSGLAQTMDKSLTGSGEQTFRVQNASPEASRELFIVMHNLLDPSAKVSVVQGQDGVTVDGTADQMELAQKIVSDINAVPRESSEPRWSSAFRTRRQITVHTSGDKVAEQAFYLPKEMSASDEAELGKTLRQSVAPTSKIYVLNRLHAIVMNTTVDQLQAAEAIIAQAFPGGAASEGGGSSSVYEGQNTATYTDAVLEQAFYLPGTMQPADANEVLVALRNTMSPEAKVYLVPSKNVLVITATANELGLAKKILNDLERSSAT